MSVFPKMEDTGEHFASQVIEIFESAKSFFEPSNFTRLASIQDAKSDEINAKLTQMYRVFEMWENRFTTTPTETGHGFSSLHKQYAFPVYEALFESAFQTFYAVPIKRLSPRVARHLKSILEKLSNKATWIGFQVAVDKLAFPFSNKFGYSLELVERTNALQITQDEWSKLLIFFDLAVTKLKKLDHK